MVYSTRRFILSLALCYCVLVCFSPFSIAITSLGEERANLVLFVRFFFFFFFFFFFLRLLFLFVSSSSLCLGRAEALVVALFGLFSYLFYLDSQRNSFY